MTEKKSLRNKILQIRKNISDIEKKQFNSDIFHKLCRFRKFINAKTIFSYISKNNEVDTQKIIQYCFANQKTVIVPKVDSKKNKMTLHKITSFKQLTLGYMGILEPIKSIKEYTINSQIELCIIPGVGFDQNKNRLGYGGGYFDRFLNSISNTCCNIGLAYENQIIDSIPTEPHDISMNYIITNKKIYS